MLHFEVATQHVATEVPIEVAPHHVHVVRAVLGAVVLDGEVVAVDAVVVGLAGVQPTCPVTWNKLLAHLCDHIPP